MSAGTVQRWWLRACWTVIDMPMMDNPKVQRLVRASHNLQKAIDHRKLRKMERIWVEQTPEINVFNYHYYRYLTNRFELFIIGQPKLRDT